MKRKREICGASVSEPLETEAREIFGQAQECHDFQDKIRKFEDKVDRVLKSFMCTRGLTAHQIESYEHFVHVSLPTIVQEGSPLKINCVKQHAYQILYFQRTKIRRPTIRESNGQLRYLRPKEAHLRKQTYSFDVLVDILHNVYASTAENPTSFRLMEKKLYKNVIYGKIPAMLGSSVCNDRHAFFSPYKNMFGLFIINGYTKTIISQESLKHNSATVHIPKKSKNGKQSFRCEIRSVHHNKIRSTSTLSITLNTSVKKSLPDISVKVPFIDFPVPLIIVFRLLGISDATTVINLITGNTGKHSYKLQHVVHNLVYADEQDATLEMELEDLFDWIGKQGSVERNRRKRISEIKHIVQNELLPHTGCDFSTPEAETITNFMKACHLAYATRKLLRVFLNEIPPDMIDDQKNKNISPAGNLIALLLRQLSRNMMKMLHMQIFRAVKTARYINISDFFNHRRITPGLNYSFSTGNWSVSRNSSNNQTGICQVWNTMNVLSRYSQLRMVNKPLNRDGKASAPRQIQPSQWGIICCAETPEGRSVGLLNVLSFMASVRTNYSSRMVVDFIKSLAKEIIIPYNTETVLKGPEGPCLLVNGILCGTICDTESAVELVSRVRQMRQRFSIPPDITCFFDAQRFEVIVDSYGMAGYRPLFKVEHLDKLERLTSLYGDHPEALWNQMIAHNVVEYVTKDEESRLFVASQFKSILENPDSMYTHLEIDPSTSLYGVNASQIPCSNRNQAPRNIYESGMCKQAVAAQSLDFAERMDTKTFILNYPQRSLVDTVGARTIEADAEPMVQMAIVAITTYKGFNVEDSIIMNQSAIDRGLFRTMYAKTYKANETVHGTDYEKLGNVSGSNILGKINADYSKIQDDGTMRVMEKVQQNDVVIGKSSNFNHARFEGENHVQKRLSRDQSVVAKERDDAFVDKVMFSSNKENSELRQVNVRTISTYVPEVGDKFASRHAQKGVVGCVIRQEDMIRNSDGMSPDIIFNPHGSKHMHDYQKHMIYA